MKTFQLYYYSFPGELDESLWRVHYAVAATDDEALEEQRPVWAAHMLLRRVEVVESKQ
jgi:hypothetical protein